MLPNGVCGETLKRKTVEKDLEEDLTSTVKVRGKTFRKIKKGGEDSARAMRGRCLVLQRFLASDHADYGREGVNNLRATSASDF